MTWYTAETGNHQGLVIEEATGRNVAVAYDKADAPLIAAAAAMLAELQRLVAANYGQPAGVTVPALDNARAIIQTATQESTS